MCAKIYQNIIYKSIIKKLFEKAYHNSENALQFANVSKYLLVEKGSAII